MAKVQNESLEQMVQRFKDAADFFAGDDEQHKDSCPYCGGLLTALGELGRSLWYRCQDCGATLNDSELEG